MVNTPASFMKVLGSILEASYTEVSVVFLRPSRQILVQYFKSNSNCTPHCTVFPENLTDKQLVKKLVAFYRTQMSIAVLTKVHQ
jgi:hypothetical protein